MYRFGEVMIKASQFTLKMLDDNKETLLKRKQLTKLLNYTKSLKVKSEWDKNNIKTYRSLLNDKTKSYQLIHNKTRISVIFTTKNLKPSIIKKNIIQFKNI